MYDVQGRIARSVVAIRRSQETKVCRVLFDKTASVYFIWKIY